MSVRSLWRQAGRVVLFDGQDRVFLLNGTDITLEQPTRWWFTPGGGCEDNETHAQAARRETLEELGIDVGELGEPVHERQNQFVFEGLRFNQHELYYAARIMEPFSVTQELWSEVERRSILGTRWWSLDELRSTGETIYPEDLADVVARLLAERR